MSYYLGILIFAENSTRNKYSEYNLAYVNSPRQVSRTHSRQLTSRLISPIPIAQKREFAHLADLALLRII